MNMENQITVRLFIFCLVVLIISIGGLINYNLSGVRENELLIRKVELEREKEIMKMGFVIQNGTLWPIKNDRPMLANPDNNF